MAYFGLPKTKTNPAGQVFCLAISSGCEIEEVCIDFFSTGSTCDFKQPEKNSTLKNSAAIEKNLLLF